jgi:hypothetical protein
MGQLNIKISFPGLGGMGQVIEHLLSSTAKKEIGNLKQSVLPKYYHSCHPYQIATVLFLEIYKEE